MHVNMETPMSYIVSSERTSRLPACCYVRFSVNLELADVLKPLLDSVHGKESRVIVNRNRIIRSVLVATTDPRFSFESPLVVDFSGEDAQDDGGPRREFLRLK